MKRQRYTLLEDIDDADRLSSTGKLDLLPAGKYMQSCMLLLIKSIANWDGCIFVDFSLRKLESPEK